MSASALRSSSDFDADPSVNFEDLLQQLDTQFAAAKPALVERFQFDLDGIKIELRRIKQSVGHRFLITATLGHLPFSIESSERRQAIRAIVDAARVLPKVRFKIDHMCKISAGTLLDVPETIAPDFIFYPLTLFLQEARPFMQLIGRYL
jgi:hypothetical protein